MFGCLPNINNTQRKTKRTKLKNTPNDMALKLLEPTRTKEKVDFQSMAAHHYKN